MEKKHQCKYPAPERVWEQTEAGWISRPWIPGTPGKLGEKAIYERDVLGQ